MRMLVTGGTGFIGSHITERLVKEGHEVIITSRSQENKIDGVQQIEFDTDQYIRNNSACFQLIKNTAEKIGKVDAVFHQAANNDTTCHDEKAMYQANYSMPRILFAFLYDFGCRKFICASSTAVYGNSLAPYVEEETECKPLNVYGKSKLDFEMDSRRDLGCPNVIHLRYCNVFGPNEDHKGRRASMIHQIIKTIKEGKQPKLFQYGWQRRDWIFVKDVVDANMAALAYDGSNGSESFNCGSGYSITFNRIVELVNIGLHTWIEPEYIPCPFSEAYQTHTECDMTKTTKTLGFKPKYTIEEGISQMI